MRIGDAVRFLATPLISSCLRADHLSARDIKRSYMIGGWELAKTPPIEAWSALEGKLMGFKLQTYSNGKLVVSAPFVYESPHAPHLIELLRQFHLERIIERTSDEYEAMLLLGAWLGARWDHGRDTNKLPRSESPFQVVDIIKAGEGGAKFWCEIASKVTVHCATALGWPSRLVTASRDGYTWEHAVAELWSNKFNKWFVMDTDFNIVYEANGVPLSAFELCHDGLRLQESHSLKRRALTAPKPNINQVDMMPFYAYIHVDLRNDWLSRRLLPGSPAGGEYSTWWTARNGFRNLLTRKVRQDDPELFNWKVNSTAIYVQGARVIEGEYAFDFALASYSPYFESFEYRMDGKQWCKEKTTKLLARMRSGRHSIEARVVTVNNYRGPISEIAFEVS